MKIKFPSMRSGIVAAFSGMLILGVTACNKNDSNDNNIDIPVAGLMAFNLAPDVPTAGIALSGRNATSALPFGSFTGGYLAVYTGDRPVESFNSASGARLASGTYNFADSAYYSLFVVGTNNNYRNVIVNDNVDALPATGQAYVRYINAIPDSTRPTVTVAAGGTNVVNESAAFAAVSEFKAIAAGDVAIGVSNGGTISLTRTVSFEANKIYTVLLSGQPGATGESALAIKFVSNGTIDASTGRSSGGSARSTQ